MKLITCVYDNISILQRFLDFYRGQGIDDFLIGVWDMKVYDEVRRLSGGVVEEVGEKFSTLGERDFRARLRSKYIAPGEWHAIADLDEFHEYPEPLATLMPKLEEYDYVAARLKDRLSADGSFNALQPGSLWNQCPKMMDLTGKVLGGNTNKIMIMRSTVSFSLGHHFPDIAGYRCYPVQGTVHHFRWFDSVERVMQKRLEDYRRVGVEWQNEPERFLEYYQQHKKVNIDDPMWEAVSPIKPPHWTDV